jgi:hypothetical protein
MRPSEDVVSRAIAGEQILVPVRNGAAQMDFIFTVNEVGAFIFGLLDGRRSPSEIASLVSREFEIDEVRARAEICEFLEELSQAGLVRPAPEEAP